MKKIWILLAICWLGAVVPLFPQGRVDRQSFDGTHADRPFAVAVQVEKPPVLDGEIAADPAWAVAEPATGFTQTTPYEGQSASERTEIRIVYTTDTLYFGVICSDRDAKSIIVTEGRRDAPLEETDSIQIILDTDLDRQNGFLFATNPAGIEFDAHVTNEGGNTGAFRMGRGPQQQGGSGGGVNVNWDASWEVKTLISEDGWSAEFAIPFRTLRYPAKSSQMWGLNVQRNIRRRNERAYWAELPRQFSLYRLSLAGTLMGIEIPRQRNLKVTPYIVGKVRQRSSGADDTQWLGDMGLDLKYSLTPSLTLDLTYNTDFAQVEVDEQQINLNRFNLFFPEKRPFFLENAGLFAVGSPREVELFFSRRIGISAEGVPIPILGGARVTGKIAGTDIGFLSMRMEEIDGVTQGNNYTVGRVRRELGNRSFVGAMFVNRQGTGDLSPEEDHNRTFAVDGRWGIGQNGQVSGFAALTATPDTEEDQHAFRIGTGYNSEGWRLQANYSEVADNFNPEVGFLRRKGFRKVDFSIFHFYRPKDSLGLLELRPHTSYQGFWNFEGFQESGRLHIDNHWEWRNGYEIHTGMNLTREGVTQPFEIFPGIVVPTGTYDHTEAQLVPLPIRRPCSALVSMPL
ncbi:carbohydrate binding family 9 domain-containing protein [Acidobacteria bacterium AH-259-D05]|nr:carbohydrate binding family 9 domain-containing protein [Acidobacteria bacterium AH-259-D05]